MHAPPFSAPVDPSLFPDYTARIPYPMDLRTAAEKLARGLYKFGPNGEGVEGAMALHTDILRVWGNARAYNAPRSCIVRMLIDLEAEFNHAWEDWVVNRNDGWLPHMKSCAAALVPLPSGGRLYINNEAATRREGADSTRACAAQAPFPSAAAAATQHRADRGSVVGGAAINARAGAAKQSASTSGFDGDEVGGRPWHLDERYMTPAAIEARKRAEESMRNIITETKEQRAERALQAEATAAGRNVVKVAVGRRVVVRPDRRGNGEGREARGIYQVDGRVLEDESRRAMPVAEFAAIAGVKKSPLKAIVVDGTGEAAGDDGDSDGMSLEQLLQMHGSIDVRARSANAQADPHCTLCGSGVSDPGNEILLCDGLNCVGCYHQKCVTPNVPEVPEGAWLCTSCIASGNIVDPHIEEEEMRMQECAVGEEKMVVMSNDGVGEQDIPLLREVVDVIDAALPLIGCINVAKLVFAPDHQSLVLVRETEAGQRRVLGAIVIKPHERGFPRLRTARCERRAAQRRGQ